MTHGLGLERDLNITGDRGAYGSRIWGVGLFRLFSGTYGMALMDQAVVSGTSFVTTVLVARWASPSQLGAYAIGLSVLITTLGVQESLVLLPYSIQRHRPSGTPAEYAGNALTLSGIFSGASMVLFALLAIILWARGTEAELTAMTWVLIGILPFALLREFGRRFAFAHLQMSRALLLDIAVAAIQLGALGWLGSTGRMSAVTACLALGAACALTGLGWLYLARAELSVNFLHLRTVTKQSWELGRWLLIGKLTVQVQQYFIYWLSFIIAGVAVTGVYAACMSVVSFANPLMFGLGNILTPKSALAWKAGGGAGLRRQAVRDSLLLGAMMAAFCAALALAGENFMHFLYHGSEFEGHGHTVAVLGLGMLATAIGMPASNALASMERPRAIAAVGAVSAVLTVVLVWWLMKERGLLGAAYGFLTGNVIGAVGRWVAFLAIVPKDGGPTPVLRVLQNWIQPPDAEDLTIVRLGEGDHACVYGVQSRGGQPVWSTYDRVIVKVFKSEAALDVQMVRAQFDSLTGLHAALDGRRLDEWRVFTPKPLFICESPLALVMSLVPGRDFNSCVANFDQMTPGILEATACRFIAAMRGAWNHGRLHGDLGLRNILIDLDNKHLSFIDPGTLESCPACHNGKSRALAALDLAHLLSDLGTDVTDMISSPFARLRRQVFAESALAAFMETIESPDERRELMDEVWSCVQAHLAVSLKPSWSPRGLWHWVIEQIAVRRIRSMLDRLQADLSICGIPSEVQHA